MQLTIDNISEPKVINNPIWKDIEDAISLIDGHWKSFLILDHPDTGDYLQCAGNQEGLTVEYRYHASLKFRHYRLGKSKNHSPLLNEWHSLDCKIGPILILKEELLTVPEVATIFEQYFHSQVVDPQYTRRNVTKLFT
jgi:hypothetical protein